MPAIMNILIRAIDQASNVIRNVGDQTGGLNNRLITTGNTMSKVGGSLTKNVTVPLVAVGAAAVKTVAKFDDSMSRVKAVSGATGGEMVKLRDQAKDMGATTRFSASEAADAMGFLALAGWDTNQILAATPAMLDLASAGSLQLATAADIVTDTMSAFNMQASEAGKASDIFAQAQAKSNTSVEQLGEAFKYSSANAHAAGMNLAQTAAVMGTLANSGIKGSMAGTTFNAMLTDLRKGAEDGKVAIGDMSVALYNSNGTMRDLGSIMGDVEKATAGMTTAERDAALGGVFHERSIRGVNIMLETGSKKYKELEKKMYESEGAAEKMATTMEDNVGGAFRELKSKTEGLLISLGEQLAPVVTDTLIPALEKVGEVVGKLVGWYAQLSPPLQGVVAGFIAFAVAIGPILMVLGNLISSVGVIVAIFPTLVMAFSSAAVSAWIFTTALLANPITWIVLGVIALIAAIVLLVKNWDTVSAFLLGVWETIKSAAISVWGAIVSFFQSIPEKIGNIVDSIANFFKSLPGKIWTFLLGVITKVTEWKAQLSAKAKEAANKFIEGIKSLPSDLLYWFGFAIGKAVKAVIDFGVKLGTLAIKVGKALVDGIVFLVTELPGKMWNLFVKVVNKVLVWRANMIAKAKELGSTFLAAVVSFFQQLPGRLWNFFTSAISKAISWGSQMRTKAIETGRNFINGVVDFFKNLPSKAWNFLLQTVNKVVSWRAKMIEKAKDAGSKLVSGFINAITSLPSKLGGILGDVASKLLNVGSTLWNNAKKAGQKIWEGFKDGLGIHSPSYLERAMDAIALKSHEMKKDMVGNFRDLSDIGIGDTNLMKVLSNNHANMNGMFAQKLSDFVKDRIVVEVPVNLDGREVSRVVTPYVSTNLARKTGNKNRSEGRRI